MDFHSALQQVKKQFGKEILLQIKVVSILSDYQAFTDVPSYRVVLRNLISDGIVFKYVKTKNTNERERLISTFVSQTGFDKQICSALLDQIYSVFTDRLLQGNNNVNPVVNNHTAKEKFVSSENESVKEIKIQKSSKLSVLGVELGRPSAELYSIIRQRGGRRNLGFNAYIISDFAGLKDAELTISEYPYSKLIHSVLIEKKQLFSRKARVDEFNRLTNLYAMKYGKGFYGLNKWTWSDSMGNSISVRFSDTKLIIEYSYAIPNIEAIESAKKKEAEDARRAELEKRRQEELKRKQREDALRKQEEALRKQEEAKNLRKNLMDI